MQISTLGGYYISYGNLNFIPVILDLQHGDVYMTLNPEKETFLLKHIFDIIAEKFALFID